MDWLADFTVCSRIVLMDSSLLSYLLKLIFFLFSTDLLLRSFWFRDAAYLLLLGSDMLLNKIPLDLDYYNSLINININPFFFSCATLALKPWPLWEWEPAFYSAQFRHLLVPWSFVLPPTLCSGYYWTYSSSFASSNTSISWSRSAGWSFIPQTSSSIRIFSWIFHRFLTEDASPLLRPPIRYLL